MANIIPSSRGNIAQKLATNERKYPGIFDVNGSTLRRRVAQLEGTGCQREILGTVDMDRTTIRNTANCCEIAGNNRNIIRGDCKIKHRR
jgi:hypothetical protein